MGRLRAFTIKILEITHGRTTAFFIAFFLAGTVLAFLGKLTAVYVAFMGTLGGLVLGHSVKEDFMAARFGPPGGVSEINAGPKG
jgi:hypothetical protein